MVRLMIIIESGISLGIESLAQTYYHRYMENSFQISAKFRGVFWKFGAEYFDHCFGKSKQDLVVKDLFGNYQNLCGRKEAKGFDFGDEEFFLDFLRVKTTLRKDLFNNMISVLKNDSSVDPFFPMCVLLGYEPTAEIDQLCKGIPIEESINVKASQIEQIFLMNQKLSFQVNGFNFTAGYLFMVQREPKIGNYSIKEFLKNEYKLEFMFAKGEKENIVGMNFLEGKIVGFNGFDNRINIGDASLPNNYQDESSFSTHLALKVTFDIFIFIFLITLIFSTIINFDKFINEDYE